MFVALAHLRDRASLFAILVHLRDFAFRLVASVFTHLLLIGFLNFQRRICFLGFIFWLFPQSRDAILADISAMFFFAAGRPLLIGAATCHTRAPAEADSDFQPGPFS